MADEPEVKQGDAAAGKGGKKGMLFVAVAMFALVAAVTVGVLAFPAKKVAEEVVEEPKASAMMPIPQVLVNLAGSNGQRLLQATVSIEAKAATDAQITDRFNADLPKVQDLLIKTLSAYSTVELDGAVNKEMVQARLVSVLNEELFDKSGVAITAVYFTEFVVQ